MPISSYIRDMVTQGAKRVIGIFSDASRSDQYSFYPDGIDEEPVNHVSPETVAELKKRAHAFFAPVMEKLSQVPADEEGRTYRLYVQERIGILDGQSEVEATIGHFNDREEQSFLFFSTPEGGQYAYDPTTGLKWTEVNWRTFDAELLMSKTNPDKTIFRAMLPPPARHTGEPYHSKLQVTRSFGRIVEVMDKFLISRMTPDAFPEGFSITKAESGATPVAAAGKLKYRQ